MLKKISYLLTSCFVCLFANVSLASASDFSMGAIFSVNKNIYKEHDTNFMAFPILKYESNNFYFQTLRAGYYLYKDSNHQFSINTYYLPLEFDPDDTKSENLRNLEKRRSTLMAGVSYLYRNDFGTIDAIVSADTLGQSDGVIVDVRYLYPIRFENWHLVPGVGVTWFSQNHNKHYYGVSKRESLRTGTKAYEPSSSFSPYVGVGARYIIDKNWSLSFYVRTEYLGDEVGDSPMVENDLIHFFGAGFSYRF